MKRNLTLCAVAVTAILGLLISSGCQKLKARDHINKGVQAFKSAKYADAVEHFKVAVELDPTFPTARLYLATAYMSQYIPGAESPENQQMAKAAFDNFQKVLDQNPNDTLALAYLASLHYSQAQGAQSLDERLKKLDEAREWYAKLAAVDPQNKEAFYSLGVIAYLKSYADRMAARAKLGMRQEDPGPLKEKKAREELLAKNGQMIEEGMKNLARALQIDPNYDEAMAYMNLMHRERADLRDNTQAYQADTDAADQWLQKTLETKKAKAAKAAQSGGITAEPTQ
jgi:tetratricopeptide (TPR) repeat protein